MTAAMEHHCLPVRDIPHTSRLYSAFLDEFSKVAAYYAHPPTAAGVDAAAREVRLDPGVRKFVVDVLREQNRKFGPGGDVDPASSRSLDRLQTGAVAIVTGQQAGLFSGPAYTFYKALTAVRCAEEATRRGVDAVPVFWLATEDHDFAEISHSDWYTRNGFVRYEMPAEDSGRRVGEIALVDSIQSVVATAAANLEGAFAADISRALHESYSSGETYGSAFGKLMARMLAGRGIIFLDQLDPRLHRLAAPTLGQAAQRASEIGDSLLIRSTELEAAGYHSQVKVSRETTLLFWSKAGRREPIRRKNGSFLVGDSEISLPQLCEAIERQPEQFSPSALLRPAIQDSILPTAAYIGGPAEIAYLAQASAVYATLGVRMPAILPRASFTIVEPPAARILEHFGLDLRDLLAGRQHLRAKMEQQSLPGALSSRFDDGENELRRLMKSLEEPLAKLDATLVESLHTAEAKMLHQIAQLKGKVARAENFRSGVLDRKERTLVDSLAPNSELQERTLCLLPQLAAHGPALLDKLTSMSSVAGSDGGHSCATQHQIVALQSGAGS